MLSISPVRMNQGKNNAQPNFEARPKVFLLGGCLPFLEKENCPKTGAINALLCYGYATGAIGGIVLLINKFFTK